MLFDCSFFFLLGDCCFSYWLFWLGLFFSVIKFNHYIYKKNNVRKGVDVKVVANFVHNLAKKRPITCIDFTPAFNEKSMLHLSCCYIYY